MRASSALIQGRKSSAAQLGEGQQQVGQVALGVDDDGRHAVDGRLLEQVDAQAGLAAAGHADKHGMGDQVLESYSIRLPGLSCWPGRTHARDKIRPVFHNLPCLLTSQHLPQDADQRVDHHIAGLRMMGRIAHRAAAHQRTDQRAKPAALPASQEASAHREQAAQVESAAPPLEADCPPPPPPSTEPNNPLNISPPWPSACCACDPQTARRPSAARQLAKHIAGGGVFCLAPALPPPIRACTMLMALLEFTDDWPMSWVAAWANPGNTGWPSPRSISWRSTLLA